MGRRPPYPREVRERAVKMVFEHRQEYASQWVAIVSIAEKFGMTAETLRSWVRQAEVDDGKRPGTTTAEAERIKDSSARTVSCGARTRSLRRRRLSLRGSSTRIRRGAERVHR